MSLENTHGLSRLHQQSFIIFEVAKRAHDRLVALPIARRAPRASINHQILRTLRHLSIEVVHQHAHSSFLLPPFAGKLGAAGRFDSSPGDWRRFGFDRHSYGSPKLSKRSSLRLGSSGKQAMRARMRTQRSNSNSEGLLVDSMCV